MLYFILSIVLASPLFPSPHLFSLLLLSYILSLLSVPLSSSPRLQGMHASKYNSGCDHSCLFYSIFSLLLSYLFFLFSSSLCVCFLACMFPVLNQVDFQIRYALRSLVYCLIFSSLLLFSFLLSSSPLLLFVPSVCSPLFFTSVAMYACFDC